MCTHFFSMHEQCHTSELEWRLCIHTQWWAKAFFRSRLCAQWETIDPWSYYIAISFFLEIFWNWPVFLWAACPGCPWGISCTVESVVWVVLLHQGSRSPVLVRLTFCSMLIRVEEWKASKVFLIWFVSCLFVGGWGVFFTSVFVWGFPLDLTVAEILLLSTILCLAMKLLTPLLFRCPELLFW